MSKMQTAILCAALIGVNWALEYIYSGPNGNQFNECYFTGSASNTGSNMCKTQSINRVDFMQQGDLSWKILTEACPSLVWAGCADSSWKQGKEHNMTRDLVWDRDGISGSDCGECPRCPCNNGARDDYYLYNGTSFDTSSSYAFQYSACLECSCDYFYQYENDNEIWITVYGRQCTPVDIFATPERLEIIECPYTTAKPTAQPTDGPSCDDNAGGEYLEGEYFFYNDNTTCNTYCMCGSEGEKTCQQGWDNILNNGGDAMKYSFLSRCSNSLQDAWDDTTRYYKQDDACVNSFPGGRSTANCPIALCPDDVTILDDPYHAVEYAGIVWEDDEATTLVKDYELYDCALCSCYYDGIGFDPTNETLTTCTPISGQTDVQDLAECTSDFLNCTTDFDDQNTGLRSAYDNYCGWGKREVPYNFDPDVVCIEDELEQSATYGGKDKYLCDAFYGAEELASSTSGFCSITDITFTAKTFDCVDRKWQSEKQQLTIYDMCCGSSPEGTAPCNNQEISATALGSSNECTSNSAVEAYYTAYYSCLYGDRGVSDDYMLEIECGVPLSETSKYSSRVCDLIGDRWSYSTSCLCKQYQARSQAYGDSDYEEGVRNTMQANFDSTYAGLKAGLETWNEYYSCGKTFECIVDDDSFGNTLKISIMSVIFIIFVNFF